jgi:hypothetical protein
MQALVRVQAHMLASWRRQARGKRGKYWQVVVVVVAAAALSVVWTSPATTNTTNANCCNHHAGLWWRSALQTSLSSWNLNCSIP